MACQLMKTNTQASADKNKKTHLAKGGDLISDFDESILSHILSRLPTKDLVQTSILSKKWRHKWTSSYNVDIASFYPTQSNATTFAEFVDRILFFTHYIRSFRLVCHFPGLSSVATWMSNATRHNLETLEVNSSAKDVVFPSNLLNGTLRKLTLQMPCTLNVAVTNYVPNLTSLILYEVQISNGNSKLAFTFPVLGTLKLSNCTWLNVKTVEFDVPSLTTFSCHISYDEQPSYSIVILGARLATYECSGGLPPYVRCVGSSVVTALLYNESVIEDRRLLKTIGVQVRELLNELLSLEELELTGILAKAQQLGPPLHRHDKLRRLTLMEESDVEQLFELLRAAPSLKYLSIHVFEWPYYDFDAMESVPSCITSHLEEVNFGAFFGEEPEYNLAKFFLKTCKELKIISFGYGDTLERQEEYKERMLAFPIVSTYPLEFQLRG